MKIISKSPSRKKFLWWGASLLASATMIRWWPFGKTSHPTQKTTAKMLTRDGKLVEIDARLLEKHHVSADKISNADLKAWIRKPSPNNSDNGQQ